MAGVKPEGKHVCMRGPKKELPQGEDGSYATSVLIEYAADPANDILIAYRQNGELLTPDHGFPVRIIIPGFIGGRMIKYLEEVTVTAEESDNYYHFFDNRVLPSHVDQQLAAKEGWWYKPEFIINQLNINSAMAFPAHDECIPLDGSQKRYTLGGYAYTGNGAKIIRCEVTLDGGKSWRLANIRRFEKPTAAGKYWCWVFWDIEVDVAELAAAKSHEIACRAWDSCQNTQVCRGGRRRAGPRERTDSCTAVSVLSPMPRASRICLVAVHARASVLHASLCARVLGLSAVRLL